MALHPGEQGVCTKHGTYDEFCGKCLDKIDTEEAMAYKESLEYLKGSDETKFPLTFYGRKLMLSKDIDSSTIHMHPDTWEAISPMLNWCKVSIKD